MSRTFKTVDGIGNLENMTDSISLGFVTKDGIKGVVIRDTVRGYVGAILLDDNNLHTMHDYYNSKEDWYKRMASGTYKGDITEVHTFQFQTDVYQWLIE